MFSGDPTKIIMPTSPAEITRTVLAEVPLHDCIGLAPGIIIWESSDLKNALLIKLHKYKKLMNKKYRNAVGNGSLRRRVAGIFALHSIYDIFEVCQDFRIVLLVFGHGCRGVGGGSWIFSIHGS